MTWRAISIVPYNEEGSAKDSTYSVASEMVEELQLPQAGGLSRTITPPTLSRLLLGASV
jgi:hypothetical protein